MHPRPAEPAAPVPDELMNQLHGANQKFHDARVNLEQQMDGVEPRHQERVDAAAANVRDAERQLEEVSEKISQTLHGTNPQAPSTPPPAADASRVNSVPR